MRRFFLTLVAAICMFPSVVCSQTVVNVSITDLDNETLRKSMSTAATALMSELNRAFFSNTTPNLTRINMTNEARQNVLQIWNNSPYRSIETELYLRCLVTSSGYQVRNIPLIIKDDGDNQDVVINFSKSGTITSFFFAIENHRYQAIMKATTSVTDLRRRQMILNFVENFRTAYNRKDIPLINDMYSDNAIIITGNVYQTKSTEFGGMPQEQVKYFKQTKTEYMTKLKKIFAANQYVNIGFEDINVVQHALYDNIYGVTLKQAWRTSNYSDDGWLFLAIHFENDNEMYVDVRTWQPYMLNGEILPQHEKFTLGDLDF
ncbi:MAG: nuclear transport factor 2 family protein [Rikenellaceae bacterium]